MIALDILTALLLAASLFFFAAGTLGILRFPDLYCRLHALTKADNVGLGLAVASLMLQAESWQEIFKLALIWILVLGASATVCFLIGNEAWRRGLPRWEAPEKPAGASDHAPVRESHPGQTEGRVGP